MLERMLKIYFKTSTKSEMNVELAQDYYIDEIDKIARKSENPSITRDVSGEGSTGIIKNAGVQF